jgi:hypothetical protein
MMLADPLIPIALTAFVVLVIRMAGHAGDVWPAPSESQFDLGWPRGVQEEEPVRFRTELVTPRFAQPGLPQRDATDPARLSPTRLAVSTLRPHHR